MDITEGILKVNVFVEPGTRGKTAGMLEDQRLSVPSPIQMLSVDFRRRDFRGPEIIAYVWVSDSTEPTREWREMYDFTHLLTKSPGETLPTSNTPPRASR